MTNDKNIIKEEELKKYVNSIIENGTFDKFVEKPKHGVSGQITNKPQSNLRLTSPKRGNTNLVTNKYNYERPRPVAKGS